MKTVAPGTLVLLFFSATVTAQAQLEGVAEMRFGTTGVNPATRGTGRVYLSGTGWRSEMEMASPETDQAAGRGPIKVVWMGTSSDTGTIYRIDEATRTYDVLLARKGRASSSRMGPENRSTVQVLGSDTIAGLPCDRVQIAPSRRRALIDACLSKEIVTGEWLRALRRERAGGDLLAAIREAGLEGYPIRLETKGADGSGLTMEVTKFERRPVPASTFDLPTGYTRADLAAAGVAQVREPPRPMEDPEKQRKEIMESLTPEQRRAIAEATEESGSPDER
jgi:Domain of unknown function (DUF4412)